MEAQEAVVVPEETGSGHGVAGTAGSGAQVGGTTSSNRSEATSLFFQSLL